MARRKQLRAIPVVREGTWLPHQPVDHVTVLDPVLAATAQTRQTLHTPARVPHLDRLRADPRLHPFADQPARHRVDIALQVDRAAAVHTHLPTLARLQTTLRQRPQLRHFLGQLVLTVGIPLGEQRTHERFVLRPAGEVPVAPQQQRLVQRPLEPVMTLLAVPVLIGLARLDGLALQTVVPQQTLVTLRKRRPFRPRRHRRRQAIRAVHLRHSAQFPQRILQALAQTLVALREADRARLPVRVGQHEVVQQVLEHHAVDRHSQLRAVREVAGADPTGVMVLREEHLPGRAVQPTPLLDPPLQRPQLTVGETARTTPLQLLEQGLRLQAGVELEHPGQLGPNLGERIGFGTPVPVHETHLAGQPAKLPVLPRRLGIDAGADRCQLLADAAALETTELAHLRIGDHREPPCFLGS